MNAPIWLSTLLSILMVAVACAAVVRMVVAGGWRRAVDYETEGLHLLAGLAAAGLISAWAHTLPRPVWAGVFVAAGVYLAARAWRAWSDAKARRVLLGGFACCAVLVYTYTAGVGPSTVRGSTAGNFTMPDMILDQTERFPALGLALVAALAFAAVAAVNRAGSTPRPTPQPAVGGPDDGAAVLLAPRTVTVCRVLLFVALAFAILSKIV